MNMCVCDVCVCVTTCVDVCVCDHVCVCVCACCCTVRAQAKARVLRHQVSLLERELRFSCRASSLAADHASHILTTTCRALEESRGEGGVLGAVSGWLGGT